MDVLKYAKSTLQSIFKQIKNELFLEAYFIREYVQKFPNSEHPCFNPFFLCLFNPDRKTIQRQVDWSVEDTSRIVVQAFLTQKNILYWIDFLGLPDTIREKIYNNDELHQSLESFLTFLEKECYEDTEDRELIQLTREIFKSTPSDLLLKFMSMKRCPTLMSSAIFERGFLLDDTCMYLLDIKSYTLTKHQIEDIIYRFRGSKKMLYKLINDEMTLYNELPLSFFLGVYYNDQKMLKTGRTTMNKKDYELIPYDDIIIKKTKNELRSIVNAYFPNQDKNRELVLEDISKIYLLQF